MSLTPQDIQSQQFHVRFRGFDVDEVDDFLEKVAENYLMVIQENKQLRERLDDMKNELNAYRDQEKSFQKAFVSAQQIAEDMKSKSEQEAKEIIVTAERDADQLRNEAHEEIAALEEQVDHLRLQKKTIRDELRNMLQNYIDGLDDAGPEVFSPRQASSTEGVAQETEIVAEEFETDEDFFPSPGEETEEAADLYEKVDLTDDFRLPEEDELDTAEDDDIFTLAEKEESSLPDLDGEMIFNLDDPLDDLTPDIRINEQEEKN